MSEDLKDEFDGLPEAIRKETNLIYDYLVSSSHVTTAQTGASNIVQSLQARNAPLDPQNPTQYDLYHILDGAFIEVVPSSPNTHDPLVALLGALKQHPGTNNFDRQFVYAINEQLGYCDLPSDDHQPEIRDAWTNLNRFSALIHKENVLDLSYLAETTLSESFKRGRWRVSWARWYPDGLSDNLVAAEGHVPAAAHWIMICGEKLYSECNWAKARWVEWESNLEWLADQDHRHEATKALCQQVLTEMQKISAESSDQIAS